MIKTKGLQFQNFVGETGRFGWRAKDGGAAGRVGDVCAADADAGVGAGGMTGRGTVQARVAHGIARGQCVCGEGGRRLCERYCVRRRKTRLPTAALFAILI